MISDRVAARRRTIAATTLAGAAAALAPSTAAAQAPREIVPGATVTGTLSESDPENGDRHYDSWRVRLREGESLQVDMTSADVDSYLDVLAPGESDEPLKSHDDIGGGSRDARLRFTAPSSGVYVLRAQGFAGGTGNYRLSVARRQVPPPPQVIALDASGEASGRFNDQSPLNDEDKPYALYGFEGRKGERVRIDMVAADLDPAIELRLANDSEEDGFSASNDDGGEGLNARLFAILPADGRYRLVARSVNDQSGSYSLRLQRYAPAGPPSPPARLRRDAPTLGRLSFDDPDLQMEVDDSGNASFFYRLYALPMNVGETVTVDLKAESFDPVLDAGVMSPLGFAVAKSNDDTDGTNSRLVLRPTESGTLYLRARSLNAESLGEYTLIVTEGVAPPPPPRAEEPSHH